MSTKISVELSLNELDALFTIIQQAEYLETEYYDLLLTGRQADFLRPGGSNIVRSAKTFITRAQNAAIASASTDEVSEYPELLSEPLNPAIDSDDQLHRRDH